MKQLSQFLVAHDDVAVKGGNPGAWSAFNAFAQQFAANFGNKLLIYLYSANDKNHTDGSYHYVDAGFDINLYDNVNKRVIQAWDNPEYLQYVSYIKGLAQSYNLVLRNDLGVNENNHLEYVGEKASAYDVLPKNSYEAIYRLCNNYSGFRSQSKQIKDAIVAAVDKWSKTYRIDAPLIISVISQESAFNPNAGSAAGAQGLMQMMPETAKGLGVTNITDIDNNIMGGTKYLAQQLKAFGGNIELALAAYNAGPGAVQEYKNTVPPFKETQNYVKTIKADYEQSKSHYFVSGQVSYSPNDVLLALNTLGVTKPDDATSMIAKIRKIDGIFNELRQLYSKKYTISKDDRTRSEWNSIDQLAYIFTYKVTGFFTQANNAYLKIAGQNLNDEKVQSQFQAEIATIIKIYNNLPNMKAFVGQTLGQIDVAKTNLASIQQWLSNAISKSVTG